MSASPFDRSWGPLVRELKEIHANILQLTIDAGDAAPITAKAPFVMVVKASGSNAPEVLEWVEALDWKAYAQAIRVHTYEHCAQVERTVAALGLEKTGV
jgi:hypothetical protein